MKSNATVIVKIRDTKSGIVYDASGSNVQKTLSQAKDFYRQKYGGGD
ncbi:hypothetical protein [Methanolapillus africanus]